MRYLRLLVCFLIVSNCALSQNLPGSGNCLTFNGTNTYVICGTSNRGITNQVTLEAWIKTTSFNNQWVVGKYSNQFAEEKGYCLATWNGNAILAGRTGNGNYYTSGFSTSRVDDGRWHHLAGVIDNRIWKIYVDGQLEGSVTQSYATANLTNSVPLLIGDYYDQGTRKFTGEIDEVRVWRGVRSETQLRELMCHKITNSPTDLVAYYRLDNNSGLTTNDAGSQPTTGTLQGFNSSAWHSSGAAIGDRSTYVYRNSNWNTTHIRLPSITGDTIHSSGFDANTRGAHLYIVDSAPTVLLPLNSQVRTYAGVFTLSNGTYSFGLQRGLSCYQLYRREDNSDPSWTSTSTFPQSDSSFATRDAYRGEYAWVKNTVAALQSFLGPDTTICSSLMFRLQAPIGQGFRYVWSDGSTGQSLSVTQTGTYRVTVTTPCNQQSDSVRISFITPNTNLPNIITPNADGLNDTFVVQQPCDSNSPLTLDLYNRWGRRVYHSDAYDNTWDGEALSGGLYYYSLRTSAGEVRYKGWIEVVR